MIALAPCPSCARHVRVGPAACPFCGGDLAGAAPLPARPVGRRAFTRAAIAAGAAVLVAACRSEIEYADDEDGTGGGERDFSSDRDTGAGGDSRVDAEEEARRRERDRLAEEQRRAEEQRSAEEQRLTEEQRLAEERRRLEEQRRLEEEMRREEELQREREADWRNNRHRNLPECVHQGTCPAPPYGAPPAHDPLV